MICDRIPENLREPSHATAMTPLQKLPTKKLIRKGIWASEAFAIYLDYSHWEGKPFAHFAKNNLQEILEETSYRHNARIALINESQAAVLIFPEAVIAFVEDFWEAWNKKPLNKSQTKVQPSHQGPVLYVDKNDLTIRTFLKLLTEIQEHQPSPTDGIVLFTKSANQHLERESLTPTSELLAPKLREILPSALMPNQNQQSVRRVQFTVAESNREYRISQEEAKGFIGRELELASLSQYLQPGRLVVVTGSGGSGKTRLVLEATQAAKHRFDQGLVVVDLAMVADRESIADAILAALGVSAKVSMSSLESVIVGLHQSELLLVLDNCENVSIGAAAVLQRLFTTCPRVCLVATSRVPLNIPREDEIKLGPLPIPEVGAKYDSTFVERYPGLQMVWERIRQFRPDFEVHSRNWKDFLALCHQTLGNPLAIELAAAKLRRGTLKSLLASYEADAESEPTEESRQQAENRSDSSALVSDAVQRSLANVGETELRALAELASLGGVFNQEIGRLVFEIHGLPSTQTDRILTKWKDQSLLNEIEICEQKFYRFPEPVREAIVTPVAMGISSELLSKPLTKALSEFVLSWSLNWEDGISADKTYLAWDPVLHILDKCARELIKAESTQTNRFVARIMGFYMRRGRYHEGLAITKLMVAMHNHRRRPGLRAYPTVITMLLLSLLGKTEEMEVFLNRALSLGPQLQDYREFGFVHYNCLEVLVRYGWMDRARITADYYLEEAKRRKSPHQAGISTKVGYMHLELGNWVEAQTFFDLAMEESRAKNYIYNLADIEAGLANLKIALGQYEAAIKHSAQGISHAMTVDDQELKYINLLSLSIACQKLDRSEDAAMALCRLDEILARTRGVVYPVYKDRYNQLRVDILTAIGPLRFAEICSSTPPPFELFISQFQVE